MVRAEHSQSSSVSETFNTPHTPPVVLEEMTRALAVGRLAIMALRLDVRLYVTLRLFDGAIAIC